MTIKEQAEKLKLEVNPFTEADAESLISIAEDIASRVLKANLYEDYHQLIAGAIAARMNLDCWLELVDDAYSLEFNPEGMLGVN
ncbi:MAG: hypothetical protein ACWGQW_02710 [bacterium]